MRQRDRGKTGYFNPRSREGSDFLLIPVHGSTSISIHAPVKGATHERLGLVLRDTISIHAPVKGATSPQTRKSGLADYFNPRSREGSDFLDLLFDRQPAISIHAPVKGATLRLTATRRRSSQFQSTLP